MKKYYNVFFSSIRFKITITALVTIVLFLFTFFYHIVPMIEKSLMDKKRETIRELVNTVYSQVSFIGNQVESGEITLEQGQRETIVLINSLRYGPENKDYFWINDMEPKMIVHPYRTDLNGKNLSDFKDPNGKKLFIEFVNEVKRNGEGYVDYMWQWKDNPNKIVPKISFVKEFKKWGWIIGSGIYIDDVNTEINNIIKKIILISSFAFFSIIIFILYSMRIAVNVEKSRREIEKKLIEKEKQYLVFVENIPVGIYRNGKDGLLILANPAFLKILGYSSIDEVNNLGFQKIFVNESDLSNVKNEISKNGRVCNYEVEVKKKDGSIIWVSLYARAGFNKSGEIDYIDGVIDNITARKNLELKSKELDQKKDEFVGIASHELRTPLTSIKGYLNMILDNDFGKISPELKKVILLIYNSSDRLLDLVNDMLDIAKLESGNMNFENKVIYLNDLISDVYGTYKHMALEKNINFYTDFDDNIKVNIDKNKLTQVLVNLVSNALKFTFNGGEVSIGTKVKGEKVIVEVKDNGVGISEENFTKVFSKFGQLNNILSDKQKGTGLGLAIVKEILSKMGSEIKLESELEEGSRFYFELDIYRDFAE